MKNALGQDLNIGDVVSSAKRVNGRVEVMIGSVLKTFPNEGKIQVEIFKRGLSLYEEQVENVPDFQTIKRKIISNSVFKINLGDIQW